MRQPGFPGRRPRWPHFDERGPDHYYDDDPWDGRGNSGWSGIAPGRQMPTRYYNESDIYEDEFDSSDRARFAGGPDDHWPEDAFYENRRPLYEEDERYGYRPEPRAWWRFSRRPEFHEPFPEDRHDRRYGSDIHDRNTNRGRFPGPRRYAR